MNYRDYNITRDERMDMHKAIKELRPYIMALKQRDLGTIKCESCGKETEAVDIHHKTYKSDLTYYDLELLCWDCHRATIGFNRC